MTLRGRGPAAKSQGADRCRRFTFITRFGLPGGEWPVAQATHARSGSRGMAARAAALLFLVCGFVAAGQQLSYKVDGRAVWDVQPSGTTVVKAQLGTSALAISIHTLRVGAAMVRRPGPGSYPGCSDTACSLTQWIHIELAGRPLWVGPYQIAGLTDVHYLAISGNPDRLDLILIGRDGAESYEAHLIFDREHVVERILYPGIDLTHPFEVSHYYYENLP